jgi:hypothetical protein
MSMDPMTSQRMPEWLEDAWLERYLERRLDDGERAWFEAYALDKLRLLDRIETDLDLRDGLVLAERQPTPAALLPARTAAGNARPHAARRRTWHVPALAAAMVAAFGAGFVIDSARMGDGSPALIADPTRVVFDTARGGDEGPSIDNPTGASDYVLLDALVPAAADYVAVRAPGLPERRLAVSRDGVATLLLRRSEIDRIGALTLVVRAGGREFEKPLQLKQVQTRSRP